MRCHWSIIPTNNVRTNKNSKFGVLIIYSRQIVIRFVVTQLLLYTLDKRFFHLAEKALSTISLGCMNMLKMAQNDSKWLKMAQNGPKWFKMSQKYLRAKVFPSCEECVADHFRGLHELIDANGYLEWDFVRSSVAGEIDI